MAERRGQDPAIKLFGRTIPLPDSTGAAPEVSTKLANDIRSNYGIPCVPNKHLNAKSSSFGSKNSNEQAISSQCVKMETDSKSEEVKTESDGSGQEKVLKKPDKILPCPRCNSMETKFCYFNNYNVNQPRHFCRNCQRYWTAGGTMRNVPVGAGRRRNKHPPHHRHAMTSCDGNVSTGEVSDASHQQCLPVEAHVSPGPVKENERITKSGSVVLFCESKAPVLNTKEQTNTDLVSLGSSDNKEEKSCATSSTISGSSENWMPENGGRKELNDVSGYCNGVGERHPSSQSYPAGTALVYPWSPGWNPAAVMAATQPSTEIVHGSENGTVSPLSLPPPPVMAVPGVCAPVVPFPLVPPLWSCIPGYPDGMWTSQLPGSNDTTLLAPPYNITCSGNNSVNLGKHSREANSLGEEKTENNLWVPKTIRITDPDKAAMSSIWASLGIKPDEKCAFKSFQSKVPNDGKTPETPQAQQANPAAFSRAQSFQEKT